MTIGGCEHSLSRGTLNPYIGGLGGLPMFVLASAKSTTEDQLGCTHWVHRVWALRSIAQLLWGLGAEGEKVYRAISAIHEPRHLGSKRDCECDVCARRRAWQRRWLGQGAELHLAAQDGSGVSLCSATMAVGSVGKAYKPSCPHAAFVRLIPL